MIYMGDLRPAKVGRGTIIALGGVYICSAGVIYLQTLWTTSFWSAPLHYLLLIGPGFILIYSGYRLPQTKISPDFYPTIAIWCLGGIGTMVTLLALYHLQPATSISLADPVSFILIVLSSIAGYEVGLHDARTNQLQRTRKDLDTTVQQLQTSNQRLEQFAYAASHDLQEPLRMVSSYLRLLERRCDDDLDEEGREYLMTAVDSADRMSAMIGGLLRYSRVASNDAPLEPVNLETVLEDVENTLGMQIEENDAEITADQLPTVMGHKDQLHQVFQNLLSNAITYSGEEPPQVHVSAERTETMWTITVCDEGVGIDPLDVDSIFDLFQRAATTEDQTGSGIGLALCEQIVERHSGDIWVDSEPGVGSVFSFTLPPVTGGSSNEY